MDPEYLKEWRAYQHSLTDKLEAAKGSSELHVVAQDWIKPLWWDRYLLGIEDEALFNREILMAHQGIHYWYARTIIPQKCYTRNPSFFNRLYHESIKALIFNEQSVHRYGMRSYLIDEQCIEYHWVKKHIVSAPEVLWVRLAEFSYQNSASFYLVEVLLPELGTVL